jgi:hypothetical protein
MMRSLVIAVCVLSIPCVSSAQAGNSSWANLSTLNSGQKIQVVQMNSRKDTGTFLNVTEAAITLQEKSGEQTIQKQDVRVVKLMKNKHRLRNTLIGAAVGGGVGAGIGAATHSPCKPPANSVFSTCIFDVPRGVSAAFFRSNRSRRRRSHRRPMAKPSNHLSLDRGWLLTSRTCAILPPVG